MPDTSSKDPKRAQSFAEFLRELPAQSDTATLVGVVTPSPKKGHFRLTPHAGGEPLELPVDAVRSHSVLHHEHGHLLVQLEADLAKVALLPITKIRRNTTMRSRCAARSTSSGVVAAIAAKLGDDYVGAAEDPSARMRYGARRTPGRQGSPGGVLAQERLVVNPDPSALVERLRSRPSAHTWLGARRDAGGRAP